MTNWARKQTSTVEQSPTAIRSGSLAQTNPAHSVWLSVARSAARVGVTPRTVKRWIRAGLLAATRLPSPMGKGHLRIRLGDLEALMARGTLQ
jgi:excisionase family DNA binding protein